MATNQCPETHPLLPHPLTPLDPTTLYLTPIAHRPPHGKTLNRFLLPLTFLSVSLTTVCIQCCLLPFFVIGRGEDRVRVWIARAARMNRVGGVDIKQGERAGWGPGYATTIYNRGVGLTKDMFGALLILITVWFANSGPGLPGPDTARRMKAGITLTCDKSIDLRRVVVRETGVEGRGKLLGLALPENLLIMSNHQSYLDWIYVWILGYLSVSPHLVEPDWTVQEDEAGGISGFSSTSTLIDVTSDPNLGPKTSSATSCCSSSSQSSSPTAQPGKGTNKQRKGHGKFLNRSHGSRGLIILLKRSLKWVPVVGWGMQFFRFIFLDRSWATDRRALTLALNSLSISARARYDLLSRGRVRREVDPADEPRMRRNGAREKVGNGLWLLIFPEGTITSDEERKKSVRYAEREGVPDFINLLHPRATGIQYCLRTLLPQIPDLKILDLTIGYPGVPRGGYAQEWYNLASVFVRGVPPPTIHIHLSMIDPRFDPIPGIGLPSPITLPSTIKSLDRAETTMKPTMALAEVKHTDTSLDPMATEIEAAAFTLWLRSRWEIKEEMLDRFHTVAAEGEGLVDREEGERGGREVVEIGFY